MKKILLIVIPSVIVLALVAALLLTVKAQHDKIMNEGVDAVGVATQIDREHRRTGTGDNRRNRTVYSVRYTYTVDGQDYTISTAGFRTLVRAERVFAEGNITVRYLPEDPNTATTIRGSD